LRDSGEPRGRAIRNPGGGPDRERFLVGILQSVFGQIEVSAEASNQARQNARAFTAR
jgi:hypothetical protein